MLLAGDIGGTKTHLALFDGRKCVRDEKFSSHEAHSLEEILEKFLKEKVEKACFGVAGPVQDGKSHVTNLPWIIDAKKISAKFNIPQVSLINDLEATAWGVGCLEENAFAILNAGKKKGGNQAVIAAGTGLGEAGLVWDGKKHIPFPSEGGHCDFSPQNGEERALWSYLHKKYGHVSWERVLSGPGIEHLYWFVVEQKKTKLPPLPEGRESPQVLEWFSSLYGAEASNLALKFLATGGIFIGGGIAPHIIPYLKSHFMQAFVEKGRFKEFLQEIPVKVILNENTALLGAAEYARAFRPLS